MNILIVKLSAIGDVVHTLPSLSAIRDRYPRAHITWVIEEASADLIANHPALDRVLVSRRKGWLRELQRSGKTRPALAEMAEFIRGLRDRSYDVVIDFHGLFKSALIVALSGGKRKIGYDSMQELSGLFLNEKVPEDMSKHAVDRYLDLARHLGADPNRVEFTIAVDNDNRLRVSKLLEAHDINITAPFIAVNPVAFWETKLWEDEKFARLCDRIGEELDIPVIITGGGGEKRLERIAGMTRGPCVNLQGKTTLRDLAYLYQKARLVVTTDSGPMHVAAAMGTPVVALFGPTDPVRTGPYGEGHRVIRKNLPCSPCFLKTCKTMQCMKEISVDEVFQAVVEKIGNRDS
ncbi:MAG: lipopolysaccharide heptosyltransferase II [Deltaproteobacteria bacterium]|nr:lipopolysaccharide heptosyltransferase II [Deltaproteobacteria bacterium]